MTLAFGEIVRIVLIKFWQSVTGGPNGVNRIPRPSFFGLPFERAGDATFHGFFGIAYNPTHRLIFLYYIILVLALLTNFITLRLRRLPIGRAWEALRQDQIACRSLGINTVTTSLTAFAIGAMFGGFAGVFFSARQGFISPESFTFVESALVLAIVVLGGLGSQLGVVIAAVALVGSAERFRELQDYRMLIFGLSMVVVMLSVAARADGRAHAVGIAWGDANGFGLLRRRGARLMGGDELLRVEHLTMRFGGLTAIDGLSAPAGEITAIIGPNGQQHHRLQLHNRLL